MSRVSAQRDDLPRALRRQRRLAPLIRRAWVVYWNWQIRRATAQLLYSLDAHVLRDLGIDPSEIHSRVHGRPPDWSYVSRENRQPNAPPFV